MCLIIFRLQNYNFFVGEQKRVCIKSNFLIFYTDLYFLMQEQYKKNVLRI